MLGTAQPNVPAFGHDLTANRHRAIPPNISPSL
uniref:Uncharacterized protein n=1 Tax=Ralstonia solanacearum TaxID=305 RepID=A0A0S4U6Z8_RALSL|nr:protein of unknown function [Ralstonia solanacearum]